jgi:hypothetical protein
VSDDINETSSEMQVDEASEARVSGIYHIRNSRTGRIYIGKSRNVYGRWVAHRYALDRGIHINDDLQGDWEIFGSKAFEFTLLEEVTGHNALCSAEARHLAATNSPYNIIQSEAPRIQRGKGIVDTQPLTSLQFLESMYNDKPPTVAAVMYALYGIEEATMGAMLFRVLELWNQDPTAYVDYGVFQDFGYRGLYGGETAKDIAARKGLAKGEKILDWMEPEELADNIFRAAQTESKLKREATDNKADANRAHFDMAKAIRGFIMEQGGTLPEHLPTPEQSIQELERQEQERVKASLQPTLFPPDAPDSEK